MTTTTTTTDRTASRDAEAVALAHTLPAETVAAVLAGTERGISRRLHGSTHEDEARADALARALRAVRNGLDVDHAVAAACRDAVRDAAERAAADALLSLDATTSTGLSLADALDAGTVGTARLSHHDDQRGGYRGVSRVPVPTDALRPVEMPAPEEMAEAARASLTPRALAVLDATVAVNVAAEAQRIAHVDALAAVVAAVLADAKAAERASRRALALDARRTLKAARTALDNAKREARADHNPHRPRTTEAAAVLAGGPVARGRQTAALADEQRAAWAAYSAHRDALVTVALAAHVERLDADADERRAVEAYRTGEAYRVRRTLRHLPRPTRRPIVPTGPQGPDTVRALAAPADPWTRVQRVRRQRKAAAVRARRAR